MKPVRVLHVLGKLNIGGAETLVMNWYRNIDRTKIQFDFVIHTEEMCDFTKEVLSMGGRIFSVPKYKGTNHFEYCEAWNNLLSNHPEFLILHGHVRSTAAIYLRIASKYNIKTIIHSHSTSNGKGVNAVIKSTMQFPIRYLANYYFSCSNEAGEWLFGKSILSSERYYLVRNAIDADKYVYNYKMRKYYRNKLNINITTKVFIHVGRFHESKNHDFLLRIFSEYRKLNKDSILILVGDGELRDSIEKKIQELGLKDNIMLLGVRNDVPYLLQASDCFLFPSKWEGLPITVVEAQAAGIPCLVSDTLTKEVKITDQVHFLPINKGTSEWVNMIIDLNFKRKNVINEIKNSGFDIKSSTSKITNFYLNLAKDRTINN